LNREGKGSLRLSPLPAGNLKLDDVNEKLKAGVNVARTAAIRQIALDVFKFAGFFTLRAV
jgi:hypothetical protein